MVVRDSICTAYRFGASDGDRVAQGYPFSLLSCRPERHRLLFITWCRLVIFCERRLDLGGTLVTSPFEVFYNVYISCFNSLHIGYGVYNWR